MLPSTQKKGVVEAVNTSITRLMGYELLYSSHTHRCCLPCYVPVIQERDGDNSCGVECYHPGYCDIQDVMTQVTMLFRMSGSRLPWHSWCHDPHLRFYDPGFSDILGAMTKLPWHSWCCVPGYHDIQYAMTQDTMAFKMSWSTLPCQVTVTFRVSWPRLPCHSGCQDPGYHDIHGVMIHIWDIMTQVSVTFRVPWQCYHDIENVKIQVTMTFMMSWSMLPDIQDVTFPVTMVFRMSWSRLLWHSGCHGPHSGCYYPGYCDI